MTGKVGEYFKTHGIPEVGYDLVIFYEVGKLEEFPDHTFAFINKIVKDGSLLVENEVVSEAK